jgi:hypothetical protein
MKTVTGLSPDRVPDRQTIEIGIGIGIGIEIERISPLHP